MTERGVQNTTTGGNRMVAPSAWASHILVASKTEALQIKDKVGKLKDFQKLARKKAPAPPVKKAATSVGSVKAGW